jgi:phenylpyruvate tautomerase PptA (4-oxalocrotonate tautomerase family)
MARTWGVSIFCMSRSLSQRPASLASAQTHETGPIVRAPLTMNASPAAFTFVGMPIYQCISPEGLLDESARERLAEEITRIHCDATGIPRSYVNVMFTDVPEGRYFVAGKPSRHSLLNGAIRVGRDLETRQRILGELSRMWTRLTGQPEEELLVTLWENPAENVMEGGSIFLGIGQE